MDLENHAKIHLPAATGMTIEFGTVSCCAKPLSTFAGSHFRWCHFGRERFRHTALKTPKSCTPSLFAKHTLYIRTTHSLHHGVLDTSWLEINVCPCRSSRLRTHTSKKNHFDWPGRGHWQLKSRATTRPAYFTSSSVARKTNYRSSELWRNLAGIHIQFFFIHVL